MFRGAYTALVTPFTKDGAVDYKCLKDLVEKQVSAGMDGLVPVGTTGESPSLDYKEHDRVIATVIEQAAGRVKVIAGTGANSTAEAVALTRHAKEAGADGTLQVTPYYNKPNQTGLVEHFTQVADLGLPVVLYNIPGRTGRDIAVDTVLKLAEHPSIVAVKEASGDVNRVSLYKTYTSLSVLSGDDTLTLPMMSIGGDGVISVATNLVPEAYRSMVHDALDGEWEQARKTHLNLHPLLTALTLDTNPIPIKAAMAMCGYIEEVYRLPLCAMNAADKDRLRTVLQQAGLV